MSYRSKKQKSGRVSKYRVQDPPQITPVRSQYGVILNPVEDLSLTTKLSNTDVEQLTKYLVRNGWTKVADRLFYPTGFARQREQWYKDRNNRFIGVFSYTGQSSLGRVSQVEYSRTPLDLSGSSKEPPDPRSAPMSYREYQRDGRTLYDKFPLPQPYSPNTYFNIVRTLREFVEDPSAKNLKKYYQVYVRYNIGKPDEYEMDFGDAQENLQDIIPIKKIAEDKYMAVGTSVGYRELELEGNE